MRATRGSAANAARRVSPSPSFAASASANSAGSFFGARPSSEMATMPASFISPISASDSPF